VQHFSKTSKKYWASPTRLWCYHQKRRERRSFKRWLKLQCR